MAEGPAGPAVSRCGVWGAGSGASFTVIRTPPAAFGQERMDTLPLPILHYQVTNIFHYLQVNVMLISDLHQARQWFPPWPLAN